MIANYTLETCIYSLYTLRENSCYSIKSYYSLFLTFIFNSRTDIYIKKRRILSEVYHNFYFSTDISNNINYFCLSICDQRKIWIGSNCKYISTFALDNQLETCCCDLQSWGRQIGEQSGICHRFVPMRSGIADTIASGTRNVTYGYTIPLWLRLLRNYHILYSIVLSWRNIKNEIILKIWNYSLKSILNIMYEEIIFVEYM